MCPTPDDAPATNGHANGHSNGANGTNGTHDGYQYVPPIFHFTARLIIQHRRTTSQH